jgi:hypothetical protein
MLITGGSAFLYLRTGVDASFMQVVPAMVVMGFGMALIFAPMTTAVLNSVPSDKSGIASAVNGAVRETGFAFGVALLGTIMNRTYQSRFEESPEIGALRDPANAATGAIQPVLDLIGQGINYAGDVVQNQALFPGIPTEIANTIARVSSEAFVGGMHRSFIITGVAMIGIGILSFFVIKDSIAEQDDEEVPDLPRNPSITQAGGP